MKSRIFRIRKIKGDFEKLSFITEKSNELSGPEVGDFNTVRS